MREITRSKVYFSIFHRDNAPKGYYLFCDFSNNFNGASLLSLFRSLSIRASQKYKSASKLPYVYQQTAFLINSSVTLKYSAKSHSSI